MNERKLFYLSPIHTTLTYSSNYTKKSYLYGWEISVVIIDVGHSSCLVKVEVAWVQEPRSSPRSSLRLPTDTYIKQGATHVRDLCPID